MNTAVIKTILVTVVLLVAYTVVIEGGVNEDESIQYTYTTDCTDNLSKSIWQTDMANSYRSNGNIIEYEIENNLSGALVPKNFVSSDIMFPKDAISYNEVSAYFILDKLTGVSDITLNFKSNDIQVYSEDIKMKVEFESNNILKTAYVYENNSWENISNDLKYDEVEECVLPFILIGGLALVDWIILALAGGITAVAITWEKLSESTDIEAEETGQVKEEYKITDDIGYITMDGVPKYIFANDKVAEAMILNTDNIYKSEPNTADYFFVLKNNNNLYFAPLVLTEAEAKEVIRLNNTSYNTWTPYYNDAAEICVENARYINHTYHKNGYFSHCHIYKDTQFREDSSDDHWPAHSFYGMPNGGVFSP